MRHPLLLALLALVPILPTSANTDLPAAFKTLERQTKGPFGENVLQGTMERVPVLENRLPAGFLFQAAYRNDPTRLLITDHAFYVGNLFTTNYYELMGEYVYGDPYGNHPLDHSALQAKGAEAIAKTSRIAQHWVLEKSYIRRLPEAKLSRSFKIRGISSYEFEVEFAKYFLSFYLSAMNDDFQYLPVFLLAGQSPIVDSASLARARDLILVAYAEVSAALGTKDPMVRALYKLRNSIHNQLTPAVINEIDNFLATFPEYRKMPTLDSTERTDIDEIRKILVEYYSFSAKKLSSQAGKSGLQELKAAADRIVQTGVSAENLLNLSAIAADERARVSKAEVLAVLTNVSRYLRKELSLLRKVNSSEVAEAALNTIYLEGFLIRENWLYFKSEIAKSTDLAKTLANVVDIASGAPVEAFSSTLPQWQSIEPKMQSFVDNILKSSAVATASSIIQKMEAHCCMAFSSGVPKVMNPGEAIGRLVYLTPEDVISESEKYRSLSPLTIPVFGELPMDLAVISGAITLKQQNLLSHVQIKSRARGTPNLDISDLKGGVESDLMRPFHDGEFVHMVLTPEGGVTLKKSSEKEAIDFHANRKRPTIKLVADLSERRLLRSDEIAWKDFDKFGSKAANYAELARLLNTQERTVVRPGFAIPFYYYQAYLDGNPEIEKSITRLLRDPLMNRVADVTYRSERLKLLRDLMTKEENVIDPEFVDKLILLMGLQKTKLRSSTNSEDLPRFNGAGLYESDSYQPRKDGVEKNRAAKEASLKKALRNVWSSVWTLRAYEERSHFGIPHGEVKMGMQVNPSYTNESVDGVVVTKNIPARADLPGIGVYIESQRGDRFSVANPEGGSHPEQILVLYDEHDLLNMNKYRIHTLQKSNVSDDGKTVLNTDNPNPVMTDPQIIDLVLQSLKASTHFKTVLDLEFKIDSQDTGTSQVYLKQARPYID